MVPVFSLFGKEISAYMITTVVGVLFTLFFIYFLAKKSKKEEIDAMFMLLCAMPGAVIGGVLFFGLTNFSKLVELMGSLSSISGAELLAGLKEVFGGSVFYGGLLCGMLTAALYVRKKPDRRSLTDLGAIAVPLFHAFGRLGCFLTGCCYGVECKLGFIYHHSVAPGANDVRRFPVQLVEMGLNLALFFLLLHLYKKGKAQGRLLQLYLFIYPVYRFILEFFRGDAYRGFLFGLSTSQLISLLILLANGVVLLLACRKKQKQEGAC